ncbi:hypothetical protein Pryu01_03011 [Paraliobacillus ryukyuensis]|uniref:Uncharacterized protein n=1 Tax=Paraliobacillus ryukyuensis TaxID=200904 RepID=A0A366DPN9_9BACI|nr:hypothetical protein [Paraliobacillus ryukyuensis]RBO92057.1 hypothetical protein DES48_11721 [Paraliobacillus ryukyuensis]
MNKIPEISSLTVGKDLVHYSGLAIIHAGEMVEPAKNSTPSKSKTKNIIKVNEDDS